MPAVLALLSSAMWGTADFLGGSLSRRRPVLAVVGWSQLAGLVLMIVTATVTGSWGTDLAYLPWAVLASVSGFLGLIAFYTALAIGTMGIVSPVAALGVLVPLSLALFGGEAPTSVQVLGIVLAVIGVVLASGPELSGSAGGRPVALALLSAVLFGAALVGIARGSQTSAVMTMTGMRASTVICFAVVLAVARTAGGITRADVGPLVTVGFFDVAANVAFGLATAAGLLSVTSVLGSLYPVVTVLLAWWFYGERLRAVQYVGVVGALTGVVLISAAGA